MNILKQISSILEKTILAITGFIMASITILIFVQVIFRYVLRTSMAGLSELPLFMLIMCVWIGGAVVAKRDDHIKIDLLPQALKNPRAKNALNAFTSGISSLLSGYFAYWSYRFVYTAFTRHTLSPGLRFPMWYVYVFMLAGSCVSALYFAVNAIVYAKEAAKR